jgi:hypothetical protein
MAKNGVQIYFEIFNLVDLVLFDITTSFLMKNRLNYYKLNSSKVYLNKLLSLQLIMTYESLNEKDQSQNLFKMVGLLDCR